MRPHRLLVAAAALSALAHLVGRWYDQPLLPAAQALAWCALAGAALTAPELPPRARYGLAVAAAAVAVATAPLHGEPQFGWVAAPPVEPGWTAEQALRGVAGIGLAVAVAALPRRAPDRRRTAAAVVLAVLAGLLAVVRDSAVFLPPYALPPDPGDVLPAYLVLVALALVALVRSGSVPAALGLGLAAVAALGVVPPAWPAGGAPGPGLVFYSAEEYRVRVTGGGVWADLLGFLAAAFVLAGCRWADRVRTRAHGAARPGS
ncbi:hypothetical protein GCM10010169_15550 [Micromonospora fulviviridis]|uniref:hypothetical protein n=1 Tax=Micromonospora fulviviridis TaxID=47860 RepID=UPI001662F1E7|nr:hypothetical protein [Micromonospora fulviviridis]GGR72479.1 hypothetical protein GCM10010169_15550 [Micromonospora fulviviridis]